MNLSGLRFKEGNLVNNATMAFLAPIVSYF